VYIIMRSEHYILLVIEVDRSTVEVYDSLDWAEERYQSILDTLQR